MTPIGLELATLVLIPLLEWHHLTSLVLEDPPHIELDISDMMDKYQFILPRCVIMSCSKVVFHVSG
jgi:hypothetical protein